MFYRRWVWIACCVVFFAGCDDDDPKTEDTIATDQTDGAADVPADTPDGDATNDADAADGADTLDVDADVVELPPYRRDSMDASAFPAPTGYRWARAIVHLHSAHSHDACDGEPRPNGEYNLPCLASLRAALCDASVDFAYLTDHPEHMVEVPFEDLLQHDPLTDTLLLDANNRPFANQIVCDDERIVTVRVGAEDRVMPIGMHEHVPGDEMQRSDTMNDDSPATLQLMRDTGAMLWVAHSEEKDVPYLRNLGLNGMEIYQLHANIDPRSRSEWLGLDSVDFIIDLTDFILGTSNAHPDLAVVAFLADNTPSLSKWAELLADGPITGTGGTDSHENSFPGIADDGERLDSYRRMMSWFGNYLLVQDMSPESADEALRVGRLFIGFDVLGSPSGFDCWMDADGVRHEMGSTLPPGSNTLHISVPRPQGPSGIPANVTTRVLRAQGDQWVEEAIFESGEFTHPIAGEGIYRVEVRTTGEHLEPYLYQLSKYADVSFPWILSNAFRVVAP